MSVNDVKQDQRRTSGTSSRACIAWLQLVLKERGDKAERNGGRITYLQQALGVCCSLQLLFVDLHFQSTCFL